MASQSPTGGFTPLKNAFHPRGSELQSDEVRFFVMPAVDFRPSAVVSSYRRTGFQSRGGEISCPHGGFHPWRSGKQCPWVFRHRRLARHLPSPPAVLRSAPRRPSRRWAALPGRCRSGQGWPRPVSRPWMADRAGRQSPGEAARWPKPARLPGRSRDAQASVAPGTESGRDSRVDGCQWLRG